MPSPQFYSPRVPIHHYNSIRRNHQYGHLIFGNPLQCRTANIPDNHLAIINRYLLDFMFGFHKYIIHNLVLIPNPKFVTTTETT